MTGPATIYPCELEVLGVRVAETLRALEARVARLEKAARAAKPQPKRGDEPSA